MNTHPWRSYLDYAGDRIKTPEWLTCDALWQRAKRRGQTPRGKFPVYPRMLFVRREILAPSAAPLPMPADAVATKTDPDGENLAMHNPLLIDTQGTAKPESFRRHVVKTVKISLAYVQTADSQGAIRDKGLLQWPLDATEEGKVTANAACFSGSLPEGSFCGMVAARLCVPVMCGGKDTGAKLGVVFLRQPTEKGKAGDVKGLTDVQGTVYVPPQPADTPAYQPARVFAIDVTRPLNDVLEGKTRFNGLAIRTVPERSQKGDNSGACEVAPQEATYLEADILTGELQSP